MSRCAASNSDGPCEDPIQTYTGIDQPRELIPCHKQLSQTQQRRLYGGTKWRKLKGVAQVRLPSGRIRMAEIHWYEAHGVGKREFKLKLPFLD